MSQLESRAALWLARICAGLVLALFVLTLSQVFLRKLGAPLVWSNDVSALLLVWASLLGAVAVQLRDEHVRIEFLTSAMSGRLSARVRAAGNILIIAMLIAMIAASPPVLESAATTYPTTLPVSLFWYRAATVVMGVLTIAVLALQAISLLRGNGEPSA